MSAALRRKIFAGCRALRLDQDARRDLQLAATGKASLSDMTEAEMQAFLDELKRRGFKPVSKGGAKGFHKPASRADLRLIHVLWGKIGATGALKDPSRRGLNAFIRSRFEATWGYVPRDVDDLREHTEIDDVIQALKQWADRVDADIDWGELRL